MLPAVVVNTACQFIAMVAVTKSGLDRLVHITWEVRKIEEQEVLLAQSCSQRYRQEEELCQPSPPHWQEQFKASGLAAHIEGLLHLDGQELLNPFEVDGGPTTRLQGLVQLQPKLQLQPHCTDTAIIRLVLIITTSTRDKRDNGLLCRQPIRALKKNQCLNCGLNG